VDRIAKATQIVSCSLADQFSDSSAWTYCSLFEKMANTSIPKSQVTHHHHHQHHQFFQPTMATTTVDVSRWLIPRATTAHVRIALPASSERNFRRRPRRPVHSRAPTAGDKRRRHPESCAEPTDAPKAKRHKTTSISQSECNTSQMGSVFVSLPDHDRPVRRSVRLALNRGSFL
jgi:hypothetical protein